MPVKKTTATKMKLAPKKVPAKKQTVAKRKASAKKPMTMKKGEKDPALVFVSPNMCRSCNALPTGSIELVSLLLVMVFALTAVLFTSVYAMQSQAQYIAGLEAQIN